MNLCIIETEFRAGRKRALKERIRHVIHMPSVTGLDCIIARTQH